MPDAEQGPWRKFGDELGLLFQIVDDVLDEDGYFLVHGADESRAMAQEAALQAHGCLEAVPADTTVLAEIVSDLATRTR